MAQELIQSDFGKDLFNSTLVSGTVIFVAGEVIGYYKCDRHYLRKQVDELQK